MDFWGQRSKRRVATRDRSREHSVRGAWDLGDADSAILWQWKDHLCRR